MMEMSVFKWRNARECFDLLTHCSLTSVLMTIDFNFRIDCTQTDIRWKCRMISALQWESYFESKPMNTNASHQKVDSVLRALYDALKVTSNFVAPQTKVYD